jgi:uncharacterized protein (TIGR02217 family)
MSMHETRIPTTISLGSSGGPGFRTDIVDLDGGHRQAVARWSYPRHRYNIRYGIKSVTDVFAIRQFYIARHGAAHGFRFLDPFDCSSSPTNPTYLGSKGTADQIIGTGDGSTTQFQLKKTYTDGGIDRSRTITKPVTGTTTIYFNGVLQAAGWTVNTTTGIVTFSVAPAGGITVSASFDFDVPVVFGENADRWFEASIDGYDAAQTQNIFLEELVEPDPGYSEDVFNGGNYETTFSANMTLSSGLGRLNTLSASAGSLSVILPDPANYQEGAPQFYVRNGGATTFTLKDHLGATLATLTSGQWIEVILEKDSGGTKVWVGCA